MAFVRLGALKLLPPGSAIQVQVNGDGVAVCNVDGTLHAIDGICPHSGGPLGDGVLDGAILTCPYHAWEFDCRTGVNTADEELRQTTYLVKVENGEILLEIP